MNAKRSYPIAITTFERYTYLEHLLDKIEKDSSSESSMIHIFDDGSQSNIKVESLNKLSAKYDVHHTNLNRGSFINCREAIQYIYDKYDHEYLFYFQDDTEPCKGFIDVCASIMDEFVKKEEKAGILSLYHWKGKDKERYNIMPTGHPGGVAWIVNRHFWTEYIENFKISESNRMLSVNDRVKQKIRAHLCDWKICQSAHKLRWKVAITGLTYVKHKGVKSSISTNRNMERFEGVKFYE